MSERSERLGGDIDATVDRIERQLRQCIWLMGVNLAVTLIIFVRVFFYGI